jgi:hypothetical protein
MELVVSMIAFFGLVLSWFVLPSESGARTAKATEPIPSAA